MSRVRVVLADLSPMLTSLITELIGSADVEVVGAVAGADLPALVADSGADVVIMRGDGMDLPEAGRRLLDDRARFRVLSLVDQAQSGVLGDLAIRTIALEDISKATLLEAVTGGNESPSNGSSPPANGSAPSATPSVPRNPGDPP
jgi:uncharacterized protein (UPF0264 family)